MIKTLMVTVAAAALTLGAVEAQTVEADARRPNFKHIQKDRFFETARENFTIENFDRQADRVNAIDAACGKLVSLGRSAMGQAAHDKAKLATLVNVINAISAIRLGTGLNMGESFQALGSAMRSARRVAGETRCHWAGGHWRMDSFQPGAIHTDKQHKLNLEHPDERNWYCPNEKCVELQVIANVHGADAALRLFGRQMSADEINSSVTDTMQQVATNAPPKSQPRSLADQLVTAIAAIRGSGAGGSAGGGGGSGGGSSSSTASASSTTSTTATTSTTHTISTAGIKTHGKVKAIKPLVAPVKKAGASLGDAIKAGTDAASSQPEVQPALK